MVYCVFVGPFKDKRLLQMAREYLQRLERLWPVTLHEVAEKTRDLRKFVEDKKGKGILVSLDAHGERMDSATFGQWVTKGPRDLYFFAWGADGPPQELTGAPFRSLSLSPMTYSHELARVLLTEQLYRAGAALKGHPYPR